MLVGALIFDLLTPVLPALRSPAQSITLADVLGVAYGPLAISLGLMFLLMVRMMDRMDPARQFDPTPQNEGSGLQGALRREWGWLPAGLIAGLVIYAASLLGQYFSIAGSLSALLAHLIAPLGLTLQSVPALNDGTAWRAALIIGLLPGAFISAYLARAVRSEQPVPTLFRAAFGARPNTRTALAFTSGVLVILGADIGGGCTTGAFMSGWPTLSLGNFAMGMVFFGTAMATAHVMYWGKWPLVATVRSRGLTLATD